MSKIEFRYIEGRSGEYNTLLVASPSAAAVLCAAAYTDTTGHVVTA
jgi:hypothetical protein